MTTYLILNLIVLLSAGLILRRRLPGRSAVLPLVGLFVLTAVFDTVIIGAGIVGYDSGKILGLRLGIIPIEDFFYALAAGLIVPALWRRNG